MSGLKRGDFVRHKQIEQALFVERVNDDGTISVRSPAADGWPFPVSLTMERSEVRIIRAPKQDDDFEEAPF
jgi:hypothetical protein